MNRSPAPAPGARRTAGPRPVDLRQAAATLAALLATWALPAAVSAQPAQSIVIEGRGPSAAEQRRLATAGVTVVDRDELDAHGDSSVLDVLQRLPGVSIGDDGPRLRGLGEGHTVVLINGEPAPPGFSMDTLAPADIERIEVTQGPTAEHGGAAGVINIILRVPPKLRQREARAALGWRAVRPQASARLSWGDRLGEGEQTLGFNLPLAVYSWANGASLEQSRSSQPAGTGAEGATQQAVQGHDHWLGQGFNLSPQLDWKRSAQQSLQAQFFVQANSSGDRSARRTQALQGTQPLTAAQQGRADNTWQLQRTQLQWLQRADDGSRLELKAGAQASVSHGTLLSLRQAADGMPLPERAHLHSHRDTRHWLGARARWPLGEHHSLVLGWDSEQHQRRELRRLQEAGAEQLSATLGQPFTVQVQRSVLFAQDEWAPHERFSALAGLRAESLRIRSAGPAAAHLNTDVALAPMLNLRLALDDKGRQLLRGGLSRSQRVPPLGTLMPRYALNGAYERDEPNTPLAADSAGNPRLLPERATGVDLSLEQHLAGGGVLSVSATQRRISGLIRRRLALEQGVDAAVPPEVPRWVSRPSNFGHAVSRSLSVEIKGTAQQLLPAAWGASPRWRLRAALSAYRSQVEELDDPEARLEGQAPWQATLGFDRPADAKAGSAWGFGATFNATPGFGTRQTDLQRVWRAPTRRLDAYAVWQLDRSLQLRLAAHNLLQPDHRSRSSLQADDGSRADSHTRRSTAAQFTASVQARF